MAVRRSWPGSGPFIPKVLQWLADADPPSPSNAPRRKPRFQPSSRRLRFSANSVQRGPSRASTAVPFLRQLQQAALLASLWQNIWFALTFLLLALQVILCANVLAATVNASCKSRTDGRALRAKALLCICMLMLQHVRPLQIAGGGFFHGASSVPWTQATGHAMDVVSDSSTCSLQQPILPLLCHPGDANGNPLHNNMFDALLLAEHPGDVLVVSPEGGLSHVKTSAAAASLTSATAQHPDQLHGPDPLMVLTAVPNAGEGDCLWLSLADEIGDARQGRERVAAWLRNHSDHPAHCEAQAVASGALASEWHVNATVQAFPECFPQGLLVFHEPCAVVVQYQVGQSPRALAVRPRLSFTSCPLLLYTEGEASSGHFERLVKSHGAAECTAPAAHELPAHSAYDGAVPRMVGAGLSPRSPQPEASSAMLAILLSFDLPYPLAQAAAARHPQDVNAALDWACSSERRHTHARNAQDRIDLTTPPASPGAAHSWAARPWRPASGVSVAVPPSWSDAVFPHATASTASASLHCAGLPQSDVSDRVAGGEEWRALAVPLSWSPLTPEVEGEHEADSISVMPPPCYLEDPDAEVHSWFRVLANSGGRAATDANVWRQMPMYTQYIREHSLQEIASHCLASVRSQRGMEVSIEQAARLPRVFGYTTLLPLAAACEFVHSGCGLPSVYVFDMFQACLASCQHKHLDIALYADQSKHFTCKARWWACPTGDPNAGKSPACSFVLGAFEDFAAQYTSLLYNDQHWIGVGNNNRIQNRLRSLEGTLLLCGPESKPILDPSFPVRKTVDIGKYLDLTRWLEAANGGRFEWGTGQDEKQRTEPVRGDARVGNQQLQVAAADAAPQQRRADPAVFNPTNINLCLFQQFSVFESWWCEAESRQQCGFTARILMTPTTRAIVNREFGLQDATPIQNLMHKIWHHAALTKGPRSVPTPSQLCTTRDAQAAVRSMYYDLAEEDEQGGWGSACKAALGKMELVPDNAVKCVLRHFDLRVFRTCSIVDSTIRSQQRVPRATPRSPATRPLTTRVLETCVKNPILHSDLSRDFSTFKGASGFQRRTEILQELARMGLGEVRETRRRQGNAEHLLAFYRRPLDEQVSATLRTLGVSEAFWSAEGSAVALPSMQGGGKRAQRAASQPRSGDEEDGQPPRSMRCTRSAAQ